EIVGKLLHDPDYKLMAEDVSRNGVELDWAWALTPGWEPGKKTEAKPKKLGFSFSSYHTVAVPSPADYLALSKREEEAVQEAMMAAMESVGLEVVSDAEQADLVLTVAIVDMDRDYEGFGWIQIPPFVELEMRLTDRAAHRDLLLVRHQVHAGS